MEDSISDQVQAIIDDCSDELNPMYEPANIKHEIEMAIRKAFELGRQSILSSRDIPPDSNSNETH